MVGCIVSLAYQFTYHPTSGCLVTNRNDANKLKKKKTQPPHPPPKKNQADAEIEAAAKRGTLRD